MKNIMEYKGYLGSVHYNDEDKSFYGKVEYIRRLVSYEGEDMTSWRGGFEAAVEDYFDLCEQKGIEPDQPFKSSFNIRPGSELIDGWRSQLNSAALP